MTSKIKTIPVVLAFAALMLAMPLTAQSAFAVGSTSSLNLECGVTTPTTIDFGAFSLDTSPSQQVFASMEKLGGEIGTFEITATDWVGVAQRASVAVTVLSPAVGNVLTVNGITFTVSADTDDGSNFQLGADDPATAAKLVTAITANAETGTVTSSDISAIAVGNTVIIRAVTAEAAMNAATISQTTGTGTLVPSTGTFLYGEDAGVVHMQSEVTKYKVTVDGSTSDNADYATKTAFPVASEVKNLAAQTLATTNLQMSLEIATTTATMELLPYNGALTQTMTFTSTCNQT